MATVEAEADADAGAGGMISTRTSHRFSLHTGVVVSAYDCEALEHLGYHGARPAFVHDRLAWTGGPDFVPAQAPLA
jgi:hypothetical protein